MQHLYLDATCANDATAAQPVRNVAEAYPERGTIAMLSPIASTYAAGIHGRRRHKRCASVTSIGRLKWQTVPKHSLSQHSWRLSPSAAAKGKHKTQFQAQSQHKVTPTKTDGIAR